MTPSPASAAGHLDGYMDALRDYTLDQKRLEVLVRRIEAAHWLTDERRAEMLAEVGRLAR